MCSPRGKGIFPEDHPQFVGVTGFAGHASVLTYMQEQRPLRVLVLGTRLGELTSFWSPALGPDGGFVRGVEAARAQARQGLLRRVDHRVGGPEVSPGTPGRTPPAAPARPVR